MAKIYLSFLGTNPYVECCYKIGSCDEGLVPVRFIQERTVFHYCKEWTEGDRIVIFATLKANARNWQDNGQNDGQPGLANRLAQLGLKARIKKVEIPDGHTEPQLWEIFDIVINEIQVGDEVIFDITHAFRSIPMLAIVILNYAKVVRKIRLNAISYGAFEALGSPKEVKERWPNPIDRVAPVLDLTALDRLLDWCYAVDNLLKAGDATAIRALARASVSNLLTQSRGKDQAAVAIRRLGDGLEQFTKVMVTCRGREIASSAAGLKKALLECSQADIINPLKPLIADMQTEVASFEEDSVLDGLHAARWCARHHLIQQGITILNETLASWCLVKAEIAERINDKKARAIASQALDIVQRERPEEEWTGDAKMDPELTHKLIRAIRGAPGVEKVASALRELRNDINHAGMGENRFSADLFSKKLDDMLDQVEKLLAPTRI